MSWVFVVWLVLFAVSSAESTGNWRNQLAVGLTEYDSPDTPHYPHPGLPASPYNRSPTHNRWELQFAKPQHWAVDARGSESITDNWGGCSFSLITFYKLKVTIISLLILPCRCSVAGTDVSASPVLYFCCSLMLLFVCVLLSLGLKQHNLFLWIYKIFFSCFFCFLPTITCSLSYCLSSSLLWLMNHCSCVQIFSRKQSVWHNA